VLTVGLPEADQARFDRERRALFPPGRTVVGAHLTLFHALPGDRLHAIVDGLRSLGARPPLSMQVTGILSLGRGVAYRVESAALIALHRQLQQLWSDRLTRQDAQPLRPHITVQNKVSPETARQTMAELHAGFRPSGLVAVSLDLWEYVDGPWCPLGRFEFAGAAAETSPAY